MPRLGLILAPFFLIYAQNAPPVTSVQLRLLSVDRLENRVSYELANTGNKAISAWVMKEFVQWPGDREMQASGSTRSHQIGSAPEGSPRGMGFIQPGEVRKFNESLGRFTRTGMEPVDRRLTLVAVVFEDGTSEGDPREIANILNQRKARANEWARWLPKVEALRESSQLRDDLRKLHDEILDAGVQQEKEKFDLPPGPEQETFIRLDIIRGLRDVARATSSTQMTDTLERFIRRMQAEAKH